jgi:hypothetical protein
MNFSIAPSDNRVWRAIRPSCSFDIHHTGQRGASKPAWSRDTLNKIVVDEKPEVRARRPPATFWSCYIQRFGGAGTLSPNEESDPEMCGRYEVSAASALPRASASLP